MHQYLSDTKFATTGLIALITHDAQELNRLVRERESAVAKKTYTAATFAQHESGVQANYWHARTCEAHQQHATLQQEITLLEKQIIDKRGSLDALSSALLQIAKQGISSAIGSPSKCPPGRSIHGTNLKQVIWAGRNQSQHYEEVKKIDDATASVFEQLNTYKAAGKSLDPKSKRNLALHVIELLDWHDYNQYEQDMMSLIG